MTRATVALMVLAWTLPSSFALPSLAGPHDPVKQEPLSPEEAQRRMQVPEGFEVRLFAAEPDVVNPVAMTWDERGRLWVVELYEYPKGAKAGTTPRDKVKVLEDTEADGKADKVTVFAEGLDLATAVLPGNGGVYVGQAPHLYFMRDTNGDGVADTKEVVLTGFGLHDRHELLNNFCWGPDGWLYMTHGVFTHSVVKDPAKPDDAGVKMNAAVARFDPKTKRFEIFADGMSNQWGVDFDRYGNAYCSACVIDHLFHVVPGGYYVRQAGQPGNPFVYDLLKSIVQHRHQAAAYSGVCVYQGDQWPAEWQGSVFMGNIHANRLNHDKLAPRGASFLAVDQPDFLISNDGWFRPVCTRVGPDGALWVMDWYDSFPCYQTANANPEGLDRRHGRIWRVVWTGNDKGKPVPSRTSRDLNLAAMSDAELVGLLSHGNVWMRREAQRMLSERKAAVGGELKKLLAEGKTLEARLAALWTAHSSGNLDEATLDACAGDREPAVRAWSARLTGERGQGGEGVLARLSKLAGDEDATVRAGVAAAARRLAALDTVPIVTKLLEAKGVADDPVLPQMIWTAAEPKVAAGNAALMEWVASSGPEAMPASGQFLRKVMRRIRDAHGPGSAQLGEAVAFLETLGGKSPSLAAEGLRGLVESYKKGDPMPPGRAAEILAAMASGKDRSVAEPAQNLSALWGSKLAGEALVKVIADEKAADEERIRAIRATPSLEPRAARDALLGVVRSEAKEAVRTEAIRALAAPSVGRDSDAAAVVEQWGALSPLGRRAAAEVMAQRPAWARALLDAIEAKKATGSDVPVTAIRTMRQHGDEALTARVTKVVGRLNESSGEKAERTEAIKQVVLSGPANLERGKELFAQSCAVCHTFHGEGATVGPDITGVGRATLDLLLANIIDPSQVIGAGYENTVVRLRDGNVVSGRLVEETTEHVKLLMQGPKEEVIPRKQIRRTYTESISVMPEGLLDGLSEQDVRDLVWYVFAPPQDAAEKAVRVEMRERKLVVLARPAGQRKLVELATYVMDPGLRPYLHPVMDPSGAVVLTDDKPGDHPWQHGIFTGLHRVGGDLDFWSEKQGRQRFTRLSDVEIAADRAGFRGHAEWVAPDGRIVLDETQTVTVYAPDSPDLYRIDFDWTLRPRDKDLAIDKYDYGGFSVRMRSMSGHTHVNSAGQRGKATADQEAAWCNVANPYDGGQFFGIAVLDHPLNLGYPSKWRVDGQGMISPSPSLKGDWSLKAGQERTFRYRLIVHKGQGDPKLLAAEHARFAPAR